MKIRPSVLILVSFVLLLGPGCGGGKKISELQRKQAANLASEADFAMNLRDWARAESLMAKVVQLTPDEGPYWVSLGSLRLRLENRSGARDAYKGALRAYEAEAKNNEKDAEPWLQQVYVLALLGRVDEARKLLDKMARRFPDSRDLRVFVETKRLDALLADPTFKRMAL